MTTIQIGDIRSDINGFNSIASVFQKSKELFFDDIELDFSKCNFFEANMSSPLFSVIAHLRNNLNEVRISNLKPKVEQVLMKNEFLTLFNIKAILDTNRTTIPFRLFKANSAERFYEYIDAYFIGKSMPSMSPLLRKKFYESLVEIFSNSAIHSSSKLGIFTCGQYFPQKQKIDFAISDAGIGIRENVSRLRNMQNIKSIEAIKWALKEGNTTKVGNTPGGLGRKLLKEFIIKNKGNLQIVSNSGYYLFSNEFEDLQELETEFPGTCVNVEINTKDEKKYSLSSEAIKE